MKKQNCKLVLHRETLSVLKTVDLTAAHGGATIILVSVKPCFPTPTAGRECEG